MDADKLLYEQFLKDDQKAYEQLVLKYKDNLIYFLQRYVKDFFTCEDLAQEVFASIFVYKERYNFKVSFKTYLFAIARNKAVDYIRKHNKRVLLPIPEQTADENDFVDKIIKKDDALLVHKAITKLKVEYQVAINLVDFEEMSYHDAAVVMNKTTGQFKIMLFRARKALLKSLREEGYTHEK